MITLTAKIDILSGFDFSSFSITPNGKNNISANIDAVASKKAQGSNPFIIGSSALGDGSTFSDDIDYFIGNQSADENGKFTNPYVIDIVGASEAKNIAIAFDTYNGRHPKSITLNGVDYYDDDAIFTITNLNLGVDPWIKISIDNWNTPNYPLVITGIYAEISIDINKRNLISLSQDIASRSNIKLPSYGVISNSGNISFNDINGEVKDYAEQLLLKSNLKVMIKLNDTLAKKSEQIGDFFTREWNYDNDNRSVSVSLKDDLEEWQDIYVEGIYYDPRYPQRVNLRYFYDYLYGKTPSKYKMSRYEDLDGQTQQRLSNITNLYPLLNSGSLWHQWNKLCIASSCYIFKNGVGETKFSYTYGS